MRKKLIENKLNFVVLNKQIYLPSLLINLTENFKQLNKKNDFISPSAQFILQGEYLIEIWK